MPQTHQSPGNLSEIPQSGNEKEMLLAFLDLQRNILVWKMEGLSENELRRPHDPDGLTRLGILSHVTNVERTWFHVRAGGDESAGKRREDEWTPDASLLSEDLILDYRNLTLRSKEIIRIRSLDDPLIIPSDRYGAPSLRWVVLHMIEETARHCGHADLIRESIDGATGYGAPAL